MSRLDNKFPPPLVVLLIGVVKLGIGWLTPTIEIARTARFLAGGTTIALGLLMVVQGARKFWRKKTTINPVELAEASTLVTTGVFGNRRNPMYVGFTYILIGWAMCLAAKWAFTGPIVFVLFTDRFQIAPEERVMQAKFDQAYDDYRSQVRRWL